MKDTMHLTIRFAHQELERCLQSIRPDCRPSVRLCLLSELGDEGLPEGLDTQWDDAVRIDVEAGCGTIAGSNPRSILIGVYRYLFRLGFRWPRPGRDNEVVPVNGSDAFPLRIRFEERASSRHRGICIEGAVSLENVLDIIDWAPKIGFNAYFTQFRDAHHFFERWYDHEGNPFRQAKCLTQEQSRAYLASVRLEIVRRGLIYHAVGHGWTCEALGVSSTGWHARDISILTEEKRSLLALVNGERTFYHGIPLNTHLCYSQPSARKALLDEVVSFARENPDVDVLHFWLADDANNVCECEACRKERLADHYVRMLNELDRRLSEEGISTRIAFLAYLELMWPPERERIRNPDRFVLMFAPIFRTFTRPLLSGEETLDSMPLPPLAPYVHNQIHKPVDGKENLSYLAAWREAFTGDGFLFDYPLMWDILRDYGGTRLGRVIHSDMASLGRIALNGMVSCQQQRAFFPTGMPMYTMGRTLWDSSLSYGDLQVEYLQAACGKDWYAVSEYLESMSGLFSFEYNRCERERKNKELARRFAVIPQFMDRFKLVFRALENSCTLERNGDPARPVHARSYRYLLRHAEIFADIGGLLARKAAGESYETLKADWESLVNRVWSMEDELQPVLDTFYFQQIVGGLMASEW